MSAPVFESVDNYTADLLDLVASAESASGPDVRTLFLDACRRDAMANDGRVSVNRVRALLADADIPPRRYSACWAHFTGPGKPMVKVDGWDVCKGSTSGNDGRPFPARRWVGVSGVAA